MGAGSGTVMLIIMPVVASGCADSTGPEDDEGRVLPRVQGVAELAVFGVAAGFKISIFNAFAVIAGPGNLEQQHASGPLTKEVGNPITLDKCRVSELSSWQGDGGKLGEVERTLMERGPREVIRSLRLLACIL